MEIVTIMDFLGIIGKHIDDTLMTNHPGGEPPDVTEGVGAVGGAAGKVCARDVQGGESENCDHDEDGDEKMVTMKIAI